MLLIDAQDVGSQRSKDCYSPILGKGFTEYGVISFQNSYLYLIMGRLKIYDSSIPRESIARERSLAYLQIHPRARMERLFALIKLSISLNEGKPIKSPQKKGLFISKKA